MSEHNYAIGLSRSLGYLTVSAHARKYEEYGTEPEEESTLAAQSPRASRKGLLAISAFSITEVIIIWVCETCGIEKYKN